MAAKVHVDSEKWQTAENARMREVRKMVETEKKKILELKHVCDDLFAIFWLRNTCLHMSMFTWLLHGVRILI